MTDWIDELYERSKDDKAIIVGSEVRALVAEVRKMDRALDLVIAARDEAVAALRDLTAECTDNPQEDDRLYQQALDRANRLLSMVPKCEACGGRGTVPSWERDEPGALGRCPRCNDTKESK